MLEFPYWIHVDRAFRDTAFHGLFIDHYDMYVINFTIFDKMIIFTSSKVRQNSNNNNNASKSLKFYNFLSYILCALILALRNREKKTIDNTIEICRNIARHFLPGYPSAENLTFLLEISLFHSVPCLPGSDSRLEGGGIILFATDLFAVRRYDSTRDPPPSIFETANTYRLLTANYAAIETR